MVSVAQTGMEIGLKKAIEKNADKLHNSMQLLQRPILTSGHKWS